jgi:hypothetical protein
MATTGLDVCIMIALVICFPSCGVHLGTSHHHWPDGIGSTIS